MPPSVSPLPLKVATFAIPGRAPKSRRLLLYQIRYMLPVSENEQRRPVVWLHGRVKTPPFTPSGRIEAGLLLGLLQAGAWLPMPHSRPLPTIGPRWSELRVRDAEHNWRIVYRLDEDAVIVVDVFAKKSQRLPDEIVRQCRERLRAYDEACRKAAGR